MYQIEKYRPTGTHIRHILSKIHTHPFYTSSLKKMTTKQHKLNKPYLVPNTNRNLTITVTVKAWIPLT